MSGYIGSKTSVTLVDGYTQAEADAEFVAKAGDTMTGGLTVGGSFTSLGIDDNATSTAVTIDSSGRVTINEIPSFHARTNYSSNTSIVNASPDYSYVEYNVGSHFSTSTNRFTAPVAGLYHFDVSLLCTTDSPSSGYSYITLMKNGSRVGPLSHSDSGGIKYYDTLALSRDLHLATNDYVQVEVYNNGMRTYQGTSINHFSGYLVG